MNSLTLGTSTSGIEVTNISAHGFWIFDESTSQEFFLSFDHFPWFADATVSMIRDVRREGASVLHWSALDVDLDIDRIRHPERYPLLAR